MNSRSTYLPLPISFLRVHPKRRSARTCSSYFLSKKYSCSSLARCLWYSMLTAVDLEGVTFTGAEDDTCCDDGDGEGDGSEVGGDGGAGDVAIDGAAAPGVLGRLKGPSALLARTTTALLLELDSASDGAN